MNCFVGSGSVDYLEGVLAVSLQGGEDFCNRVLKAYRVLSEVRDCSDGHGITFVVRRDGDFSRLDKHLRNAKPYNGTTHSLDDPDIVDVVVERRERDLATIINADGVVEHSGVYLPADDVAFQEKYGIWADLRTFLGYEDDEEGPGGRRISALCASDIFGDPVVIVTLGENHPGEVKGDINMYYCGDRILNDRADGGAPRTTRWDLAERRPQYRERSGSYDDGPCDRYQKKSGCGAGQQSFAV